MRQLRKLTDTPSEHFLLETALSHLRVTNGEEVPLVLQYLSAAREVVERLTGRALLTQTYELAVPDWGDSEIISLDRNPVSAITSVKYYDANDADQTLVSTNYLLHTAEDAAAVIAWGSCASWGCVQAAKPNPTTAVPISTGLAVALKVFPAPSFSSRRCFARSKSTFTL